MDREIHWLSWIDRCFDWIEQRWWVQCIFWFLVMLLCGVVLALDNPREYI